MGDKFTVADAYLFTVLNWTNRLKIDLGKWPIHQEFRGPRRRQTGSTGDDEGAAAAQIAVR